ncbi:MAG TPA: flavin reductase family protein, partial [Acidimicrobiales bacterium]|nr:flavin reductase family protein [Acidimicrobiales bacterium]
SFKQALGAFASSVNVITVRDKHGRPCGMTATAFCSVSVDPLLVLVCVNQATRTHERILRSGAFGVNVLSDAATEVAAFCARSGSDKFLPDELLAEVPASWAAPALNGVLAYLDCEVYRRFPAGTHGVVIGRVRGIALDDGSDGVPSRPLLHYQGTYHSVVALAQHQLAPGLVGAKG